MSKLRYFAIVMLLCALQVNAMTVKRVSQGSFNAAVEKGQAMYII